MSRNPAQGFRAEAWHQSASDNYTTMRKTCRAGAEEEEKEGKDKEEEEEDEDEEEEEDEEKEEQEEEEEEERGAAREDRHSPGRTEEPCRR